MKSSSRPVGTTGGLIKQDSSIGSRNTTGVLVSTMTKVGSTDRLGGYNSTPANRNTRTNMKETEEQRRRDAETKLMDLNIKAESVKRELQKLDHNKIKTGKMIKQKVELENELESLTKQIAPLKQTIRTKTKIIDD